MLKRILLALVLALSSISPIVAYAASSSTINLCVAYDTGGPGDRSYNDAVLAGLIKAKKTLSFNFEGFITDGTAIDREKRLRAMIVKGCSPILAIGSGYASLINLLAVEFPNQQFSILNDRTIAHLNVTSLIFADKQVGYLAGSAAARLSNSGKVALISTSPNANLENGFSIGATAAKKKIKVSRVSNSVNLEKSTSTLIAEGVDVIFLATNGSDNDILNLIVKYNESKKKSAPEVGLITIEPDQFLTISASTQKYLLAAISKRVDNALFDLLSSAIANQQISDVLDPVVGIYGRSYGVTGGNIEFSYFSNRLLAFKAAITVATRAAAKL